MTESPFRFVRKGDEYLLSNGVVEFRGELCEDRLIRAISIAGGDFGWLDLQLKASSDGRTWDTAGVMSLADVKCEVSESGATLDLFGEWWKRIDRWGTPDGISWRVHVRMMIGAAAERFEVRVVDVVNNGVKPLRIAGAEWRTAGAELVSGMHEISLPADEKIMEPWECRRLPDGVRAVFETKFHDMR